jgi:hypothetical protein
MEHELLNEIGLYIIKHKNLGNYLSQEGVQANTFWQQLRSDLMRQNPGSIKAYLTDPESRLNHKSSGNNFGTDLYEKFFNGTADDDYIKAAIFFCLEMDAAEKMKKCRTSENTKIKSLLKIWEVK